MRLLLLVLVLALFGALTAAALADVGYLGILARTSRAGAPDRCWPIW